MVNGELIFCFCAEILDDADLTSITAKKVRQQLEAKLKTDLTDRLAAHLIFNYQMVN